MGGGARRPGGVGGGGGVPQNCITHRRGRGPALPAGRCVCPSRPTGQERRRRGHAGGQRRAAAPPASGRRAVGDRVGHRTRRRAGRRWRPVGASPPRRTCWASRGVLPRGDRAPKGGGTRCGDSGGLTAAARRARRLAAGVARLGMSVGWEVLHARGAGVGVGQNGLDDRGSRSGAGDGGARAREGGRSMSESQRCTCTGVFVLALILFLSVSVCEVNSQFMALSPISIPLQM